MGGREKGGGTVARGVGDKGGKDEGGRARGGGGEGGVRRGDNRVRRIVALSLAIAVVVESVVLLGRRNWECDHTLRGGEDCCSFSSPCRRPRESGDNDDDDLFSVVVLLLPTGPAGE